MKNNFIIAVLVLGILINGWAIVFLELPFYREVLFVLAISILVMTALHEKYVFLIAITVALSYGAFLTIFAFANKQSSEMQLLFMYDHLLLTSFLLMYWILMNVIKKIGYENSDLNYQLKLLQKYTGVTQILTLPEFYEQAQWVLKSSDRNKEVTLLVKISITSPTKRTKLNLQEGLERLALQTIRQKFDLITSEPGIIYLLLKNTQTEGAQKMLERFHRGAQAELNLVDRPYHSEIEQVIDTKHLATLVGKQL